MLPRAPLGRSRGSPPMHFRPPLHLALAGAVTLLVSACNTGPTSATDAGPTGDAASGTPTFSEHIAPLVTKHCRGCHTKGGIAPFAFDDYATTKTWGKPSRKAIEARTMPPWGVDASGACGTWQDARWLTDAEIKTFGAWVDGGMPVGNAKQTMPVLPKPTTLGANAIDVPMPIAYTPKPKGTKDAPTDDYRCFRIDPKLTAAKYVTGFEVVPGDPRVVHHVLLFSVAPKAWPATAGGKFPSNDAVMKHLDDLEPDRPGWECFGAAGDDVLVSGLPATWAPGTSAVHYPAGTGVKLEPGEELVMQVHYSMADVDAATVKDLTRVRLELADKVERQVYVVLHDPFIFKLFTGLPQDSLPPGKAKVEYPWQATVKDFNFWIPAAAGTTFDLVGVLPHLHKRGRALNLSLQQGEGKPKVCAADVPRWDFDWQQIYFYDKATRIDAETRFHVNCVYDTTDATAPVMAGYGTDNEMCLFALFLAKPASP
ncbi:MAG: hypothetical protein EXR79_06900 [Myxococcales bacterium]|nr:hypothetical protein [Myxococcales bacterium]